MGIGSTFKIVANMRAARTINVSSPDDPAAEQSEEVLELANGCLCCSIKDTGVAAIEKLMQRKGAFDHILLETTGLADPGSRTAVCILDYPTDMTRKAPSRPFFGTMKNLPRALAVTYLWTVWFALLTLSLASRFVNLY